MFCLIFQGPVQINAGCLFSGLDQTASAELWNVPLTSDIIVQGHRVNVGELKLTVFTVFGAYDSLEVDLFLVVFLCKIRSSS